MSISRSLAGAALVAGAALAPPGAQAAPPRDAGVSGVVRADGRCVARGLPCPSAIGRVTVVIRDRSSGKRVRTLHPRDGRFHTALAPGGYRLRATTSAGLTARRRADVRAHHFTVVVLRLHARVAWPPRGGRAVSVAARRPLG